MARYIVTYDNFHDVIDAINEHLKLGDIKVVYKNKHCRHEKPFYGQAEVHYIEKEHKQKRDYERCLISLQDKYSASCMPIHEGNIVILNQFGIFVVKNNHSSRICKTPNYLLIFDFTKWEHILRNLVNVLYNEYTWYEWYDNSYRKKVYAEIYEYVTKTLYLSPRKIENKIIQKCIWLPIPNGKLEIRLTLNLPGFIQDGRDCKDIFRIEFDGDYGPETWNSLIDAQHAIYKQYFREYEKKKPEDDITSNK